MNTNTFTTLSVTYFEEKFAQKLLPKSQFTSRIWHGIPINTKKGVSFSEGSSLC